LTHFDHLHRAGMASKRPGFERADTDKASGNPLSSTNYELQGADSKGGPFATVRGFNHDDAVPQYEEAENEEVVRDGAQLTDKVETAADIITKVIHVDDDPEMNPLTFRTFFVGRWLSQSLFKCCRAFKGPLETILLENHRVLMVSVSKASDFRASVASCRKYFTSSLRQSSSL